MTDTAEGHSALMGYAFDGFGIFGHRGEHGQVMTNAGLDECHGHTHLVEWDGQLVEMYHYHATWEFPYTVSCFRGISAVRGPLVTGQTQGQAPGSGQGAPPGQLPQPGPGAPPAPRTAASPTGRLAN